MNTRYLCAAATLCALLGSGCSSTTAHAATSDPWGVMVSYADLNLSHAADARVLYQRLRGAAARVCNEVPTYDLARSAAYRRCFQAALDRAVADVHSPALSAIHHGARSGPEKVAGVL
jgi:UrcA family protein